MARKVRHAKLDTRSARSKLPVRRKPYNGPSLARGVVLLFRRNRTNGSWILKASDGHGKYWTKAFAEADDFDEANGQKVQTFYQAQDTAKKLAGGGTGAEDTTTPVTVDRALTDYERDLATRKARTYNARLPRVHLTAVLLSKPVQLLSSKELKAWRDGLLGKITPASVNRICNSLCAALELARLHDPLRIKNADAWEIGCAGLPDSQRARNIVLPDATVHALVAAAYRHDPSLGLLVDLLATTGARPSQAVRLRVEDLHASAQPKLMMPKSGKGGGRNRAEKKSERYSVPITVALAKRLKAAAAGRAPDAALLVRANGLPWPDVAGGYYRKPVRVVVTAVGEDPDVVTLYALRHSNITRMLLKNIPIRLIASLHNTSIHQIEKNYSRHITEHHSDDISRAGLLAEPPATANVIPLR